jgi:hypothetical protein
MKTLFTALLFLTLFGCEIDNSITPKTTFPGNSKEGRAHNKHYPTETKQKILTIAFGEGNLSVIGDDLANIFKDQYYLQYDVPNSSLFVDWNFNAPVSGMQLYNIGRAKIDSTLSVIPKPDVIRFIWVHGETDAQVLEWSQEYGENQAWMINLLDADYGFNQIIDYNLQGSGTNVELIREGKEQNAGAIPEKIVLIDVPLENFVQAVAESIN